MNTAEWHALVTSLEEGAPPAAAQAAAEIHAQARLEDVPRLLVLLESDDFFVREAAAWPLAELVGPFALPQLLAAYQRGFDDGHDNDGFTAALLEIPALHPSETPTALMELVEHTAEPLRGHAEWLLGFCRRLARGMAPNLSIERTRTGMALRPRSAQANVAPRGLRTTPARAAHVGR